MEILDTDIVNGQPVQIYEPGGWFGTIMTFEHYDALIDAGFLAHVDVAWLMAGEHGMDVKPFG